MMDHWQMNDELLTKELELGSSRALLMIDKQPLVDLTSKGDGPRMVMFDTSELKKRLSEYGLEIGALNACLLDLVDETEDSGEGKEGSTGGFRPLFGFAIRTMQPPEESGIPAERVRRELARSLGGELHNLRYIMLTTTDEWHRNMLAKFQSLTRWYHIYRHCPHCANLLHQRVSKAHSVCVRCDEIYYPAVSPAAIALVKSPCDDHCLLVRHKRSAGTVFTCIAGFSHPGETLLDTVRREVAEEVGVECWDVRSTGETQPWPMPASSMMCAFTATADRSSKV